jgi:cytochrome P450
MKVDYFFSKVPCRTLTLFIAANRLYTNIPVNVREATKTTVLPRGAGPEGQSPLLIRKGFGIGFSPYHMHRNKELYGEDANEFRPERWEGPELKNIGCGFMPFHGGPRICLGS